MSGSAANAGLMEPKSRAGERSGAPDRGGVPVRANGALAACGRPDAPAPPPPPPPLASGRACDQADIVLAGSLGGCPLAWRLAGLPAQYANAFAHGPGRGPVAAERCPEASRARRDRLGAITPARERSLRARRGAGETPA